MKTMDGKTDLRAMSALVFHTLLILLVARFHTGEAVDQLVEASIGISNDVSLPCHVEPAMDATDELLEWSGSDMNPRFVHVRRDGEDHLVDQNPSYTNRTSVSVDGLKHGNMSLRLSTVRLSDEGIYRCFSPGLKTDSRVQLVVAAVIEITKARAGVLECKSAGWYPEPELLWLDGDGNLLSAGPTETVRGPDGFYTVSSRVTVEKKHNNNNVTCRVQQNNEHRDAEFHVTDDFFTDPSAIPAVIGLILFALVALGFALCAWRQNRTDTKEKPEDEESQSKGSETESLMRREKETQQEPTMLQEQLAERGDAERASTPVTRETANQSLMNENTKETLTEHSDTSAQKPTKGEEEKLENPSATETKTKDTKENSEDEESQSEGSEKESLMRREKETQQEPTMLQEQLVERGDAERASTSVTRETANQSLMNENTKETLTEHSDTSAQKPTKGEEEKLENPSATETKTKDTKENSEDEESQSEGSEKESLMRREKETQQEPTMLQEQLVERGDAERASTSVTRETASDEQSVKSGASSESEPERQQDKDHRDEENTEDQKKRAEAQQQSENNEAGNQLVGTKPDIEEEKEANKTNECDNSSKIQSENQEGTPSPGTTESRTCQENVSTSDNRNSRSDSDENSDTSGPNPTEEDNKQPGDSSAAEINIKIPETSGNDGEAKTESEEAQNPGSGSAV